MKKIIILLLSLLCMTLALAGCSEADKIAFEKQEYTIEEGESFVPEVIVRPKRFGYELFSGNNTILTVDGDRVVGVKAGIASLRAVSGNKEAEVKVYVVEKKAVEILDPTFLDSSYVTFSVINYADANLDNPVISTGTWTAGTEIGFPSLTGYDLTWYIDEDGNELAPSRVLAKAGQNTYYAVATARVNRFLIDKDGRVTGLEYPNLAHENLVFPSSYNDVTLTGVADHAFYGDTTIKTIVIPRTFTYIGNFAFAGCTSLTSVKFAEGSTLTEIGAFAFGPTYTEPKKEEEENTVESAEASEILSYLDSLLDSVGLSQLLQPTQEEEEEDIKINEDYCAAISEFTLPASVKTIGSYAFYNSTYSSALPESVETISYGAFRGSKITSVDLKNVKKIEAYAFYDCTLLSEVTQSQDVEECGGYAFYNTALYNTQLAAKSVIYAGSMVVGCSPSVYRAELHFGTTLIADYAFNNVKQDNLTVIFIEGEKVRIGWESFYVTGYRSQSNNQPIYSENLFLAVGKGESEEYRNKYPLLADRFCERTILTVSDKDAPNFGIHSLLKLSSGKYVYDLFIVGTTGGKYFSPYEIDLSTLDCGSEIIRINTAAFSAIAHLTTLRLYKVETVADCAVSGCANLSLIDFTDVATVPVLQTNTSFLFSGFADNCVVEIGKENYDAFYYSWENRVTARGKLGYRQNVSFYVDGEFSEEVELLLPAAGNVEVDGITTWHADSGCEQVLEMIPLGTVAVYGRRE